MWGDDVFQSCDLDRDLKGTADGSVASGKISVGILDAPN